MNRTARMLIVVVASSVLALPAAVQAGRGSVSGGTIIDAAKAELRQAEANLVAPRRSLPV